MISSKRGLPGVYEMGKYLEKDYDLGYHTFLGKRNPLKSLHAPIIKKWAQTRPNCLEISCAIAEKLGYSPISRSQNDMNRLWDLYAPGGKRAKLRSPVNMLLYKASEDAKQGHVVLEAWGRKYNYGADFYSADLKVMRRIPLLPIQKEINSGLNLGRFFSSGKKGIIGASIATSLLLGSPLNAHAANMVDTRNISIEAKSDRLKYLTNYIAGMTETSYQSKVNVRKQLYETAVHESGGLRWNRQVAPGGKPGVGRSIFMIEPTTAKNLVDWAKSKPKAMSLLVTTSGKAKKELLGMSKGQLADLVMENDKFAAAMARTKYLSVPGRIPDTLEARAKYWADYYMAGANKTKKAKQYIADSKRINAEVKAAHVSRAMKKHIPAGRKTAGLVNQALHNNKTSSKMGTASYKAVNFLRKLISR